MGAHSFEVGELLCYAREGFKHFFALSIIFAKSIPNNDFHLLHLVLLLKLLREFCSRNKPTIEQTFPIWGSGLVYQIVTLDINFAINNLKHNIVEFQKISIPTPMKGHYENLGWEGGLKLQH